jgi:hypothetical protein
MYTRGYLTYTSSSSTPFKNANLTFIWCIGHLCWIISIHTTGINTSSLSILVFCWYPLIMNVTICLLTVPCGIIFFLYNHFMLFWQFSHFSNFIILNCFYLKLLPQVISSRHRLADILDVLLQLFHRVLEDPKILRFWVQLQLLLSLSNWSPLKSFSKSRLQHLELRVWSRLP